MGLKDVNKKILHILSKSAAAADLGRLAGSAIFKTKGLNLQPKQRTMRKFLLSLLFLASLTATAQTPEEKLAGLNIQLPQLSNPVANYVHVVRTGNLLFLAGKGPQQSSGEYIKGKLGKDLTVEQGYEAAKLTGIIQLAVIKDAIGNLSKVKRIVKVNGYVNSEAGFYDHPKVINGFSDLMVAVFGDKGKHARTSLGVAALPMNMAVEVEMIVEVED